MADMSLCPRACQSASEGVYQIIIVPHSRRHSVLSRYGFQHLGIAFISFPKKNIDTGSPLGKAVFTIISAMAELDRNIIVERIRGGLQSKKRWLNLREERLAV